MECRRTAKDVARVDLDVLLVRECVLHERLEVLERAQRVSDRAQTLLLRLPRRDELRAAQHMSDTPADMTVPRTHCTAAIWFADS